MYGSLFRRMWSGRHGDCRACDKTHCTSRPLVRKWGVKEFGPFREWSGLVAERWITIFSTLQSNLLLYQSLLQATEVFLWGSSLLGYRFDFFPLHLKSLLRQSVFQEYRFLSRYTLTFLQAHSATAKRLQLLLHAVRVLAPYRNRNRLMRTAIAVEDPVRSRTDARLSGT